MNNSLTQQLFTSQLKEWILAANNYAGLQKVQSKTIVLSNNEEIRVQYNPSRIISSSAKVDKESIKKRPCFLCKHNRPQEQISIPFEKDYEILVNPFPIFPNHLTIAHKNHIKQNIEGKYVDMLALARHLKEYFIFYNGPQCGASAPDHFHFQAGNKGVLPIEEELTNPHYTQPLQTGPTPITATTNYSRKAIIISGKKTGQVIETIGKILHLLKNISNQEQEPMINLLAQYDDDTWRVTIFPRGLHRPRQYYLQNEDQIMISPASVDMGGLIITPREEDFQKTDAKLIEEIYKQVTLQEPEWNKLIKQLTS